MLTALLFLAAAANPSAEAERLALRLARASALATMAPLLIDKDLDDLAAEDPGLSAADRTRLTTIGRRLGRENTDRLVAAMAHQYARRLSLADLRLLVSQAESPAAARRRAAEPGVVAAAAAEMGRIDIKKDTAAALCRDTGRLCRRR